MTSRIDPAARQTAPTKRLLAIALLIILGAIGYFAWSVTAALSPDCATTVLFEKPSVGGRFVSTAFIRDCGATTNFATILSIRAQSATFDPETRDMVLVIKGKTPLSMRWIGDEKLEIDVPPQAEIVKTRAQWSAIAIDIKQAE